MRRALSDLGAYLVGGHTEVTPAVNRPIVVGQMLGLAETGTVVTTANPLRQSADFCIWADWRTPTSASDEFTAIADDWPYVNDAMS